VRACTGTDPWTAFSLDRQRLVGFEVVTGPSEWITSYDTIRSIRPLFDAPPCEDTIFDLTGFPSALSLELDQGTQTVTLVAPDSISSMYGAMDGTSWFGPRTFALQGNPDWLSLDGDQLTITSNSMFDYTETVSVTI
jgi:hypothetical protein